MEYVFDGLVRVCTTCLQGTDARSTITGLGLKISDGSCVPHAMAIYDMTEEEVGDPNVGAKSILITSSNLDHALEVLRLRAKASS